MAGEPTSTIIGNLTDDPKLKFTQQGTAICEVNVASNTKRYDKQTQTYVDGEPLFMRGVTFKQYAESVAESLRKGDRVIMHGKLEQQSYTTKEGQNRTVIQMVIDEIGPSLRYATAQVTKTPRDGGGYQQQPPQQQAPQGFRAATPPPQQSQQQTQGQQQWGNQPTQPSQQFQFDSTGEPPF